MPRSLLSRIILLLVALMLVFATPVLANQQVPGAETTGIQAVSPDQFAQKIDKLMDGAYRTAAPITDAVAKIMLAVTGVAVLLVLFSGMKLFQRVLGSIMCIGFGLLLFYGAPYVVGLINGLAQYATQ